MSLPQSFYLPQNKAPSLEHSNDPRVSPIMSQQSQGEIFQSLRGKMNQPADEEIRRLQAIQDNDQKFLEEFYRFQNSKKPNGTLSAGFSQPAQWTETQNENEIRTEEHQKSELSQLLSQMDPKAPRQKEEAQRQRLAMNQQEEEIITECADLPMERCSEDEGAASPVPNSAKASESVIYQGDNLHIIDTLRPHLAAEQAAMFFGKPCGEPAPSVTQTAFQTPIKDLLYLTEKFQRNPNKVLKKELCSEHDLRKTLFCSVCRKYICDKCYVKEVAEDGKVIKHSEHQTVQISKMAYEVVSVFDQQFKTFHQNLESITQLSPDSWAHKIRTSIMQFFDGLQANITTYRDSFLLRLRAILKSTNLEKLAQDVKLMEGSYDTLKTHHDFLQEAFEQGHFSTIAARFRQYKILIKAMEVLTQQSHNYANLVTTKYSSINSLETDLKGFKKNLQSLLEQQKEMQEHELSSRSFEKATKVDDLKSNLITPFYIFMKNRLPTKQKELEGQGVSYLEIVAILQEEWEQNPVTQQYFRDIFRNMNDQLINLQEQPTQPLLDLLPSYSDRGFKRIFKCIYACVNENDLRHTPSNEIRTKKRHAKQQQKKQQAMTDVKLRIEQQGKRTRRMTSIPCEGPAELEMSAEEIKPLMKKEFPIRKKTPEKTATVAVGGHNALYHLQNVVDIPHVRDNQRVARLCRQGIGLTKPQHIKNKFQTIRAVKTIQTLNLLQQDQKTGEAMVSTPLIGSGSCRRSTWERPRMAQEGVGFNMDIMKSQRQQAEEIQRKNFERESQRI